MRAVIQRVSQAQVTVEDEVVPRIGPGMLILLGIARDDEQGDAEYLAQKVVNLRIFDAPEEPNHPGSAVRLDAPTMSFPLGSSRSVLVVSQFTLYGDVRRGRRPSFDRAAPAIKARGLYEYFLGLLHGAGVKCESGRFQEMMAIASLNDGPVTILLDSHKEF